MKNKYSSIVVRFREEINKNQDFLILYYLTNNDKNDWNRICSAMDWMTVAADYLDNKLYSKDINIQSMLVYTYISSIDIIWEAIIQLHQAIFKKEKSEPFNLCNNIFKNKRVSISDNRHFKHIRAVFGAHPIDVYDKKERRFACWPTNHVYEEYDWAVSLYSSEKDKDNIIFGFIYEEVQNFLDMRIAYLDVILLEIKKQQERYYNELKEIKIEKSDDIIKQIEILKNENLKRFNSDHYKYILEDIEFYFQVKHTYPENQKKIDSFKIELKQILETIYQNLQTMNKETLVADIISCNTPTELIYPFEKFSEVVHNNRSTSFLVGIDEIKDFVKQYFTIEDDIKHDELYMLLIISFYHNSNKNK